MISLPIDTVPGSKPQRFRWKHVVKTLDGARILDCEGTLPVGVEGAIIELIALVKKQDQELDELRNKLEGAYKRVAGQSELLSKHAEKKPKG